MLDKLQKKLEQLFKDREQTQIALFNYNGAITILQNLIQEEQSPAAQQEKAKLETPKKLSIVKKTNASTDPGSN